MVPLLLVNSSLLKIQCCKVCANDKALLKSVKYLYRSLINQYGHFVIEPNADQASFHLNACTVTRIHFEARGKSKMVYHKVSTSYLSPIIHVVFGSIVWLMKGKKMSLQQMLFSVKNNCLQEIFLDNHWTNKLKSTQYIEDITWPHGDTKFLFECWRIFHKWVQWRNEIFFNTRKEISYL